MRRPGFLLGAGASRDAELPTSGELTTAIERRLAQQHGLPSKALPILRFVTGELLAEEGRKGNSVSDGLDIERVLTAIELLGDRSDLEISPFVHSWNPYVNALDSGGHTVGRSEISQIKSGLMSRWDADLERPLRAFIQSVAGGTRPSSGTAFRSAFSAIERALVEILDDPADTSYLRPLFDLQTDGRPLTVATLNYDRTIEIEGERRGTKVETGIESWAESGRWNWSEDGVNLLKLHGSIDWTMTERHDSDVLPQKRIVSTPSEDRQATPAVILGGRNKLRADGPFLDLLAELSRHLNQLTDLVVVGYSFRDAHVNEILRRWLNSAPEARVVVLDPGFVSRRTLPDEMRRIPFSVQLYEGLGSRAASEAIEPDERLPPGLAEGRDAAPPVESRIQVIRATARDGLEQAISVAQSDHPFPDTHRVF